MIPWKFQLGLLLLLLLGQQDVSGTIEGRVLMNDGKPAAGMTVLLEGEYPPATLKRQVQTDTQGYYAASGLGPGRYAIYTFGVDYEKYPPRLGTFLQSEPDARAVLEGGGRVVRNLVMPLPVALLDVTAFSEEGTPMKGSRIVLCHVAEPQRSADFGSVNDATVSTYAPANEPIAVLAVSPSGLAVQMGGFKLRPGEKRSIAIHFKKETYIEGKRCITVSPN